MTVRFPKSAPPPAGNPKPGPQVGQTGPTGQASGPTATAQAPAAEPVDQTPSGYGSATLADGPVFPDRQPLALGVASKPHNLSASLSQLETALKYAQSQHKPPLSPSQQASLDDAVQQLDLLLKARPGLNKAEDRAQLRAKLRELAGQLQANGLMTPQVKAAFNQVTIAAVATMGKELKPPLQVATYGSRLGGLIGPSGNLSHPHQAIVNDASGLLGMINTIGILPGPLTPEKLMAMGLREQLVRLSSEMMLPPPNDIGPAQGKYEDQILLLNGVAMLDEMMKGEKIPANLLADMSKLVQTARDSGGKGLKQAFDTLAATGGQLQQAGQQVNNGTATLGTIVNALSGAAKSGAPDLVTPFNNVISNYATASTAAASTLPKFPFPITVPVPLNLGTPPNSIAIPAGSTLSYNAATQNYNLSTNGMQVNAGGTSVQAGTGTIQLGPTIDRLNFSTLNINSGGTNISSTGNTIRVDKTTNSSLMQAQNVNVNWANGQVTMSQVSIVQNPNAVMLGAQNLAFQNANTNVTASNVTLGQTVNSGVTTTGGSGSNVNINNGGTSIQAGQLSFNMTQDANTGASGINFAGSDVHILSGKDKIDVGSGVLNIANNPDGSSLTTISTQNGAWTNGTQSVTSSATAIQINQNPAGQITQINAQAADLHFADGKQKVDVLNGSLQANYGPSGQLSQLTGSAGMAQWSKDAQQLTAIGVNGQVNYGPTGQVSNANVGAAFVNYSDGKGGVLNANNGNLNLNYNPDGSLKDATVSGDALSYSNAGGNGKPLGVTLGKFTGTLTPNTSGGQDLNFNGQNLNVSADKTTANIPIIQNLQLSTGADGKINTMHVELPASNTVKTEDLNAALKNVQVDYKEKVLTATAEQVSGNITKPDLTGTFTLNGAKLIDTEQYTSLHLDSSSIDLTKLKDQYKLDVQNIDLVLDKNAVGQLTGGQLRFEDLQGQLKGYTVTGTNEDGKQMVLSFGLSEDGKMIQKLGFEIPKGGELSVNKGEDWFLKLGGDQKFGMNYDASKQIYNFTASNLNAQYINKDLTLDVSGLRGNRANLDISLTPDKGLVINDISNLSGKITLKDPKGLAPIEIDIDKIKGFYLKQTNITGASQGMMLHLAPTGPDSTMTASIRTAYHGIPLGISFKNVHELKVGGQISTNNARVYIGDPSGRGQIEIQAGPLKLKGSEIDISAKYHMYDSQRMLNSLDKLMSDNNINILGRALSVDPIKGKVTLDTTNRRGPYLQANVLFPSPVGAALRAAHLPFPGFSGIRDEGVGVMFGTGWRWRGESTDNQLGLDFGLLPGSYLSLHQHKGEMTFAGVPLPSRMTLGTTPYAGLNFKQKGEEHTLGAYLGVSANPAAFAPESARPFIYEDPQARFGAHAGLKYQSTSGVFLGVEYTGNGYDPKQFFTPPSADERTQGWNHTGKLNLGFQF